MELFPSLDSEVPNYMGWEFKGKNHIQPKLSQTLGTYSATHIIRQINWEKSRLPPPILHKVAETSALIFFQTNKPYESNLPMKQLHWSMSYSSLPRTLSEARKSCAKTTILYPCTKSKSALCQCYDWTYNRSYILSCVPQNSYVESNNHHHHLRMWLYLETGPLRGYLS